MSDGSVPNLEEFDPRAIPYQHQVIRDVKKNLDYSLGVHELMLSGSVGCLREDALIQTVSGEVPICDITAQHYVLGFDDRSNRFALQSNSGAFLKGKDCLYRVIGERGEFVASGNHHIASSRGVYVPVSDLYLSGECGAFLSPQRIDHELSRSSYASDVLHCWKKLVSFWGHCAKRIRQCDPQLLWDLEFVLGAFPLQDDALRYGLFSFQEEPLHEDDRLALESIRDHTSESLFHRSMLDFCRLLEDRQQTPIAQGFHSKPFAHILADIEAFQRSPEIDGIHPTVLLSFLARCCISLTRLYSLPCTPDTSGHRILKIEKLKKEEWFWDIQVPNINNYVSHDFVHHNSAKSILMAHLAVRHCIENQKAVCLLGRRAMPDLKDTILKMILEHVDGTQLIEGKHYDHNMTSGVITFCNGSQIVPRSWADKRFKKMRSLALSMAVIEELTESPQEEKEFYSEIKMRVGRLPHVRENLIISATNPDSPAHWAHKYFIQEQSPTRHVYYSRTEDNPFLPKQYIDQLKRDLDPKTARRMLYGEWIEINTESVYYQYSRDRNFVNESYTPNLRYPIRISHDFNIGLNKPMSAALLQYVDDTFHIYGEAVLETADTHDIYAELANRGVFEARTRFIVHGDASGKSRDTRSKTSDYDIARKFLSTYRRQDGTALEFEIQVPLSNPPVRARHNRMNAYCQSADGKIRLKVYRDAPTVDEALRLTSLKKGGQYIEDDSKRFQHIGTAVGYAVMTATNEKPEIKEFNRWGQWKF